MSLEGIPISDPTISRTRTHTGLTSLYINTIHKYSLRVIPSKVDTLKLVDLKGGKSELVLENESWYIDKDILLILFQSSIVVIQNGGLHPTSLGGTGLCPSGTGPRQQHDPQD